MGTRVTPSGVSIQFCDRKGNIKGQPIFSTHVRLLGRRRSEITKHTGMTPEETHMPGSDDWLTLIAVAHSQARLDELVKESEVPHTDPQTSGSSRRVQVILDTGDGARILHNRITIASGPITSKELPIMHVNHIKVLDEGAVMDDGHPLKDEFMAQTPVR